MADTQLHSQLHGNNSTVTSDKHILHELTN